MGIKHRGLKRRSSKFVRDVVVHTPVLKMTFLLIFLWMLFSAGIYYAESGAEGTTITSYGRALYWGVAAFSMAGIADMPVNGISEILGGIWIVLGSMLFFGAIVATVTAYFMRPLQRPSKQIIDTIEYNLEQLDDLILSANWRFRPISASYRRASNGRFYAESCPNCTAAPMSLSQDGRRH